MTAETEYFALLWEGDDIAHPRTIIRRRATGDDWDEEILLGDGTWEQTGILALVRLNLYEHEARPLEATAALNFVEKVTSRAHGDA